MAKARFTLLELLIVIALIMMLAGLLLPALKSAKEQGNRIACANNIKQIYLGCMGYVDSYSDYMPVTDYSQWDNYSNFRLCWLTLINTYINGKTYDGGGANTARAFYCPAGQSQNLEYPAGRAITNYMYSDYLGFYDTTWGYPTYSQYGPHRLSKCPKPSAYAILIDGRAASCSKTFYEIATRSNASNYADIRHLKAINVLFADGHVGKDKILLHTDSEIQATYTWKTKWQP